jgi:hypothetical protein
MDVLDREEARAHGGGYDDVLNLVRGAVKSLEGFLHPLAGEVVDVLRRDPGAWEWAANDFYSREVIAEVPGMVSRFLRLNPVLVGVIPNKEVSLYLEEASRAFIYGLFQAAIAVSRAALEVALDRLLKPGIPSVDNKSLNEKIKAATEGSLLSPQAAALAHGVRKAGRDVLHHDLRRKSSP